MIGYEWFSFKKQVMLYQVAYFFCFTILILLFVIFAGEAVANSTYLFPFPVFLVESSELYTLPVYFRFQYSTWETVTLPNFYFPFRFSTWEGLTCHYPPHPGLEPTSLFLIHISYSWPSPLDPSFLHIEQTTHRNQHECHL